ncbi:hypothetical protein [Humisphaera borealis]|uniref:Uncharacterized protein n=1 Tax=Humisphaera borealis TaxID=2807512 RepID=A0A7M2WUC7_9BACT|nr:hypothetical protein [Humisphaera borealis]QOV88401.1 hypothetical protein IPV69_19410 [Humisphaera borealis]
MPLINPRRGTAEIELVLSVVVMITLLMLTLGAMKIAIARLDTANTAEFEAFYDATSAQDPQYTGYSDLTPIGGVGNVRPGLPDRTHVAKPTARVTISTGNRESLTTETGGKAGLISPAWNYSGYPVGSADHVVTGGWFGDYANESHGQLTDPLRLAPAWTP